MHRKRPWRSLLSRSSLLPFAAASLVAQQQPQTEPPPADYVVHEWGTFTSMVGQAGIALEGLHREEEALPKFVHDLQRVAEHGVTDSKLPASRVTQKMETPVIYFYSEAPLRVRVDVWFQQGLMTQFYPLPTSVYPRLAAAGRQRIDLGKIDGSQLRWDIDVLPHEGPAPAGIPAVANDDPWQFARETRAAFVRTVPEPGSPAKPEAEHYLFYRGLGRYQPAVAVADARDDGASFTNNLKHELPFCAVLELGDRGGRFALGPALPAGGKHRFALGAWQADRERVGRQLGAHVLRALVHSGLFEDEARAMVATWSRSWFQKDGARVLYLLPRSEVDTVLPLQLTPRPKALVRTLVGRLEFITEEAQAELEQALRDAMAPEPAIAAAGNARLLRLDRFLEPHLRNIEAHGSDPGVRALAATRLAAPAR